MLPLHFTVKQLPFRAFYGRLLRVFTLFASFVIVSALFLLVSQTVSATVNSTMNFQGKVVNLSDGTNIVAGSPSCVAAGADTCDFRASIYTDSTGGTLLWQEPQSNVELGDYEGVFNLSLNSVCASWSSPGGSCSGSGLTWGSDSTIYLQIEFDDDGNGDFVSAETFTRKLLTSVPYAYEADQLDGIDSTGFVQLAPGSVQTTGNTTNPLIYLNENGTGTPNLLQLQVAGSDIATINNSGDLTITGDANINGGTINSTSVLTFNDSNTLDIAFSDASNTTLPVGTNSILHALNAASGGGGGLWTINANVTYLTSSGSDLSLASTLVSAFSVDESENLVRVGDGSSSNGKIDFYSSTGDTGRFEYITDTLQWSGGSVRIANNTSVNFGSSDQIQVLYDSTTDTRLEFSDGTNLLLALDDAGTTGDLLVTGTVSIGGSSNDVLATSAAAGAATSSLYWGNQTVCLADGTGCSTDYGLWEALSFNTGANTGTFENDNDVIVGTWAGDDTPLTNTGFVLDSTTADDLFVLDLLGVGDSLYVENNIVAGSGALTLSDSGITDGDSNLVLTATGANVVQISDALTVTGGTATFSGGNVIVQHTTPYDIVIDNSTVGVPTGGNLASDSGYLTLRGNFFDDTPDTDTELDMSLLMDVTDGSTYRLGFYNDGKAAEIGSLDESGNLQVDGTLNLGTNTADVLSVGAGTAANGDLYWGDDLLCDTSQSNCGWAAGGSTLFTDGGTLTYLTQTADDFAIGGSALASPFSVDTDINTVRIGDGTSDVNDPTVTFYASNAVDSGSIIYLDADGFQFSGGDVLVGAASETIAGAGFVLNGDDLFVNGQLGVEGDIYTDADLTLQSDVDTTGVGDITINFGGTNTETIAWIASLDGFQVSDDLLPSTDDALDLGSNTLRWRDLYTGPGTIHVGTSTSDEGTLSYNTTTNDLAIESTGDLVLLSGGGYVGIGTATTTAFLDITAPTTSAAQINLSPSVAVDPSAPVNGDMWYNGTNLNFYNGSVTTDLLAGSSSLWTDGGTLTYLTSTTDDVVFGGTTSAGPFFFDTSAGKLTLNTVGAGAGIALGDDTLLYDGGTNLIQTADSFTIGGQLTVSSTGSSGGLVIGDDTNLYDNGTNLLQTDDSFTVGGALSVTGGAATVSGGGLTVTGGNVLVQGTTPLDVIVDNSTTGTTANSGALYLRGNYFNVSDTEIDMSILLNVTDNTDYKISFYDDGQVAEVGSIDQSGNLQVDGNFNLGTDTADVLSVGTTGSTAIGDLYWGDDLICDSSQANCGIAFGGSSLFTDGGALTYLTQTTDDFSVGGTALASAFSVDVSANTVRIGSGATADAVLSMFASDASTGTITFTTSDRWEFSGGDILLSDDQSMFFGTDADAFFRYDELTDNRLEFGFGANQFGYIDDVAAQTYGDFLFNGTTTLGTGLAGTETALYINPTTGFTGTLLDIDVNGSDIFAVSTTGITANVPATFASAGDVQIANDLAFTNSTSSNITSDAPLYITAGDIASSEDLYLSANNAGYVIVDDRLEVADLIHLGNASANNYLATSVQTNTPTTDLYWGDKLVCDVSEANCGNIWTDSGTVSYLTSTTDDFAIGGTSLTASLSMDVSANLLRVGTGATANGKIDLYSSNGNSARLELTTTDTVELNNAGFVFNQAGDAVDFVIEGDTDANLITADGSTDRVGIGVAVPDAFFDVKPATAGSASINISSSATVNPSVPVDGDMWYNGTNLYFYDGSSTIDILAGGSGSSKWTDGGTLTYLTSITDDLAVGASSAVAPLYIDVDTNLIRIGDGASDVNDPTLTFYASDAVDSGSLIFQDDDSFFLSGGSVMIGAAAETIAGTGFVVDGDDVFIAGMLGVEGDIYSDGDLYIQSDLDTTLAGDISINFGGTNTEILKWDATNDAFSLSDDFLPATNDVSTLGIDTLRWADLFLGPNTLHIGTSTSDEGTVSYDTTANNLLIDSTGNLVLLNGGGNVGIGTTTTNAFLDITAPTTASAQLNLSPSIAVDPSAPVDGDMWYNGTNLYFYDGSSNTDLLAGGGSTLFTDGGAVTYLTSTTDDFALGGSTLAASVFAVDESTGDFYFGSDNTTDPSLLFEASDADAGQIDFTTNDRFELIGAGLLLDDDQSLFFGANADAYFSYDELTDDRLEFGFGANQFGYIDDVTAQTYGDFNFAGTTSLGTALAGTETALYINPTTGFTGTLLDIDVDGADIFTVTSTGITADVPATFNSAGDVSIANDINFTNGSSSTITSLAPLYITAGDAVSNDSLILSAQNAGYVIVDDRLQVEDIIHLGGSADNFLAASSQTNAATDDLYWGDKLLCDASVANCGYVTTALWADGTSGYYSNTESVIVGADAAFSYVTTPGAGDLKVADDFEAADDGFIGGDLVVGASTSSTDTISDAGFVLGGDDLFVAGLLGVEGAIYTDDDLYLQTDIDTTLAGDISINFGGTNTEIFKWDATADAFDLSDDITVNGNITISGAAAGLVYANVATGSAPTCDSTTVGTTIYNRDAAEDGTIYLCRQNTAGAYEWRDITNGAGTPDIAEFVRTNDTTIEAGDIVSVSLEDYQEENIYNRFLVEKSNTTNVGRLMGIISTDPGILLNTANDPNEQQDLTNLRPLALAGRVPVKISAASADIVKGDPISASDKDGQGQKLQGSGMIVGIALEEWTSTSGDTDVMVLIKNTHYDSATEEGTLYLGESGKGLISFNEETGTFEFDSNGDGIPEMSLGENNEIEVAQDVLPKSSPATLTDESGQQITDGIDLGSPEAYFDDVYANTFHGQDLAINNFDVAEEYLVEDMTIMAGDVVRFKKDSSDSLFVERTDEAQDKYAIGVISTKPGLYLKDWQEDRESGRPVALAGRVPVKVTDENGPVHRGDFLTPASTPGYAMKAVRGGVIIGRAMEDFDPDFFDSGDSEMVTATLGSALATAEEEIAELVESGELSDGEATEFLYSIQEEVTAEYDEQEEAEMIENELMQEGTETAQQIANSEKTDPKKEQALKNLQDDLEAELQDQAEYTKGRVMMFVDVSFVNSEIFGQKDNLLSALKIESFALANGDNLFEINDNVESTKLKVNVSDLIVAGSLTVEGDLDVLGILFAQEAATNSLFVERKINVGTEDHQAAGEVTLKGGMTKITVENNQITPYSSVHITKDQFVNYRVIDMKPGIGFTIQIDDAIDNDTVFNYFIIN
ncbi:MAG: hypothetical protein ACE5DX_00190 [Candidatus Dojkabacteria bacterium]